MSTVDQAHAELEREQQHLDELFDRRDSLIGTVARDRAAHLATAHDEADRTTAAAAVAALTRREQELERADRGLCFGRVDTDEGEQRYIGRIGLPSEDEDADPLLVDWRAPAARPFYTATAAQPLGLHRRRHIRTDQRTVLSIDDELLDAENTSDASGLVGEAALMEALDARRTGAMGDVVATLQGEQDEIIRASHRGCLVVQGGPGTGKTAVALHRAAYLLFTHTHLVERGVLVVGPSPAFLDYIDQVLPSLGETQVVATTVERLLPGAEVGRVDTAAAAEVKGRALWADVLRRSVQARQPVSRAIEVPYDGERVTLDEPAVAEILARARAGQASHHLARERFREQAIDALAAAALKRAAQLLEEVEHGFEDILGKLDKSLRKQAEVVGVRSSSRGVQVDGVATAEDAADLRRDLATSPDVLAELDSVWPTLDPQRILGGLLADRAVLAEYAPELTDADRAVVCRPEGAAWSVPDIALLDELADLVGETDRAGEVAADNSRTLAERASADRTWAFGHVIVDEAQELSAMQWRMLVRRCPTRSFTLVGDVNQAYAPGSAPSWEDALASSFGDRWRRTELTISYRTPREVMERTAPVLAAAGSSVEPPRSVRSNDRLPTRREVLEARLVTEVTDAARELSERYRGGQVAVIALPGRHEALRAALGSSAEGHAQVRLVSPLDSKGLEFDAVVLVDPHAVAAGPRGWSSLYVCMTRCTQELHIVVPSDGSITPDVDVLAGQGWSSR
ncbi:HelD family protein [Luteipulveratus mongoliensis]|nr:AAA family ATPase [Luteipulveratus mongoliensis]